MTDEFAELRERLARAIDLRAWSWRDNPELCVPGAEDYRDKRVKDSLMAADTVLATLTPQDLAMLGADRLAELEADMQDLRWKLDMAMKQVGKELHSDYAAETFKVRAEAAEARVKELQVEMNKLDTVVHALGIEDSDEDPGEEVRKLITRAERYRKALAFAQSVIKSGESWSSQCEEIIGAALQEPSEPQNQTEA